MNKAGYVYILASKPYGTLYVGVTSDLPKRVWQHREGIVQGFTEKYDVKQLVYFEAYDDISFAIEREKELKGWNRAWKIRLIERNNPEWRDLFEEICH